MRQSTSIRIPVIFLKLQISISCSTNSLSLYHLRLCYQLVWLLGNHSESIWPLIDVLGIFDQGLLANQSMVVASIKMCFLTDGQHVVVFILRFTSAKTIIFISTTPALNHGIIGKCQDYLQEQWRC